MDTTKMAWVGAAESCITPPEGTELAGYFTPRIAAGVISPLMAKAIVAGEGDGRVALIACDLITMTAEVTEATRRIIQAETGIQPHRVMVCSTHTHTGPELRLNRLIKRNEAYFGGLSARIAQAAIDAAACQRPAVISAGIDHEEGLAFNRRFRTRDGREQFGLGGSEGAVVGVAGPTDPQLGVVAIRPDPIADPIAVIVNYSLHIDVTGGSRISADFPAVMTEVIRGVYGPDVIVLYVQGACGNINHVAYQQQWPWPPSGEWKSRQLGRALGGKAINIIEKGLPCHDQSVDAASEILDVPAYPLDDIVAQRLAQARSVENPSFFDQTLLDWIDSYDPGERTAREVQALRLGDAVFNGAPGELFVEWGLEMKKWSPHPYTFIAELANDSVGYIPTYEAFRRGGYEATPVVSVRSTPALGQMIADANFRLNQALWERRQAAI